MCTAEGKRGFSCSSLCCSYTKVSSWCAEVQPNKVQATGNFPITRFKSQLQDERTSLYEVIFHPRAHQVLQKAQPSEIQNYLDNRLEVSWIWRTLPVSTFSGVCAALVSLLPKKISWLFTDRNITNMWGKKQQLVESLSSGIQDIFILSGLGIAFKHLAFRHLECCTLRDEGVMLTQNGWGEEVTQIQW